MCNDAGQAGAAAPRPVTGSAVDPITLPAVDEVVITTLVDNCFDALLTPDATAHRATFTAAHATAPQFDGGRTDVGLLAEHGFSALLTVRRGAQQTTLLFDTGLSPDGMVVNAERLGVSFADVQAVVLSHGHFDHAGGLAGLARARDRRGLPMVLHPQAWTRRRLAPPQQTPVELPTLSRSAVEAEGFTVVERRTPSLLAADSVLITGEIDRTTEYERGMPAAHQALRDGQWQHDPLVSDDQALVVHLRGLGLVVLTGCGHAGVVNTVRHALRLTGVERLHAVLGGFHLGGPAFEPSIPPTVAALAEHSPALLAPGHCTGWRAQQALAEAFPHAWIPPSSGTRVRLTAAPDG